jgi:uncharacterized protein (DUF427 family)
MVTATWNGAVIARSDDTVVVEGNHYFPRSAVDPACLRDSPHTSLCPWKGTAHYFSLLVDGAWAVSGYPDMRRFRGPERWQGP